MIPRVKTYRISGTAFDPSTGRILPIQGYVNAPTHLLARLNAEHNWPGLHTLTVHGVVRLHRPDCFSFIRLPEPPKVTVNVCGISYEVNAYWNEWVEYLAEKNTRPDWSQEHCDNLREIYRKSEGLD